MNALVNGKLGLAIAATIAYVSVGAQTWSNGATQHSMSNNNAGIWSGVDVFLESNTDFYLNGFNVVGGSTWDSGFNVGFNGNYWDNNATTSGTYTLGTQVTGTQSWSFAGLFGGMFALGMNSPVAEGSYSTTIELVGGSTDTSSDVLFSFTETIDVVDYGLDLSSPDATLTFGPGDNFALRHRLHNPTSNLFLINSRYMSWGMPGVDQFDWNFSDPYPTEMTAGSDVLVEHMHGLALPTFTTPFSFTTGIMGGRYSDDAVWQEVSAHTFNPVPEPGTIAAVGLGILGLARRRRRN